MDAELACQVGGLKKSPKTGKLEGRSQATYLLWKTADGARVESSVLFISRRSTPWVICLPSTVACPFGCRMCAMPASKNARLLLAHKLVHIIQTSLEYSDITRGFQVSFMGQREPFINIENVFDACKWISDRFPDVEIGVSTVGLAHGIRELGRQKWAERVNLQISLHSWPGTKRREIIPAESDYPVEESILEAARLGRRLGKESCLNITLLKGINDSPIDALSIEDCAMSGPFYVKLSKYNPHSQRPFEAVSSTSEDEFYRILLSKWVKAKRFLSLGTSIEVGYGQTRIKEERKAAPLKPPEYAFQGFESGETGTFEMGHESNLSYWPWGSEEVSIL